MKRPRVLASAIAPAAIVLSEMRHQNGVQQVLRRLSPSALSRVPHDPTVAYSAHAFASEPKAEQIAMKSMLGAVAFLLSFHSSRQVVRQNSLHQKTLTLCLLHTACTPHRGAAKQTAHPQVTQAAALCANRAGDTSVMIQRSRENEPST